MLSSDTQLGCNWVCCIGEPCNSPLGRYANTDGETLQVIVRASAVAQLRVVVLQERAKADPTGTVFWSLCSIAQCNGLIPSPFTPDLCAPSLSQESLLTQELLSLPQCRSPQFHLLPTCPAPFPYSTTHIQVKASFPSLMSNVRTLCCNEPSLNPPEDRCLARIKHQPAGNQDWLRSPP